MDTRGIIGQIARIRQQSHTLIEEQLRSREIEGIVPAHGTVLAFLFQQTEPVPIKSVVQKVGRVKSTVTGMIKTLERHGYIRRFQSTEDQRVVYIALTEKGRALQNDFEAISVHLLAQVYGDMPPEDREALVQLLAALEHNLQNGAQSA